MVAEDEIARNMVSDYKRRVHHGFVEYTNNIRDVYVVHRMVIVKEKATKRTWFIFGTKNAANHCEQATMQLCH